MTYCIAAKLDSGLVFLSDSRTNAGVDQVSIYRKMTVFEYPGKRVLVLMTAGNLAISQAVLHVLQNSADPERESLWNAPNMFEAARIVGQAVRQVYHQEVAALQEQGVDFNISILFGGQIAGGRCRLFQVYAAGNFIETRNETPYFQIGEAKYGKPLLDRVIRTDTSLNEAAKCALLSMDSTLRSNISVGLPLDLLVYEADSLCVTQFATIDARNEYFRMLQDTWGERLRQIFTEIPDPLWTDPGARESLVPMGPVHQPLRARPANKPAQRYAPPQVLANNPAKDQQRE
jgi:putative proteasome-type protease